MGDRRGDYFLVAGDDFFFGDFFLGRRWGRCRRIIRVLLPRFGGVVDESSAYFFLGPAGAAGHGCSSVEGESLLPGNIGPGEHGLDDSAVASTNPPKLPVSVPS